MIVCNKCGKKNQDHYKFCLGCGNEITAPAVAPPPEPAAAAPPPEGAFQPPPEPDIPATAPSHPTPVPQAPQAPSPVDGGYQYDAYPLTDETVKAGGAVPLATDPTAPNLEDRVAGLDNLPAPEPEPEPAPAASFPSAPEVVPLDSAPLGASADPVPQDAPAAADEVVCSKCNLSNPKAFAFCGNCGNRLGDEDPSTAYYGGEAEPAQPAVWGELLLIRPDGSEGGSFSLKERDIVLGRGSGPLFDQDGYLSPRHARLVYDGTQVFVEDLDSLNGVFIKITRDVVLKHQDIFRIGQELLRYDIICDPAVLKDGTEIMGSPNPGYWGRLSLISGPDIDGSAFPLMGEEMVIGRERGDILFPDDGYVSGVHAKISAGPQDYVLSDLDSSNGSFVKLYEPQTISSGTFILMGQQLFRFELI